MNLDDFLLARFAEDEEVASNAARYLAAYGRPDDEQWVVREDESCAHDTGTGVWVLDSGRGGGRSPVVDNIGGRPTAEHIARHDPARVLAECEAKRRIVEHVADQWDQPYGEPLPFIPHEWERILRLLALPYADHPDYREEWRPVTE